MNKIINTIKKHTTGKTVLIFLFLTVIGAVAFGYSNYLFSQLTKFSATLDLSFFYSVDFANNFFKTISSTGTSHYLYKFTTIDTIFPIFYSVFFALLVAYILKKKNIENSKLEYLILLPFISMLFDYLENILTIILMNNLHEISQILIYLLTISSSIKWGVALIGIPIIIGLLFIKKKNKNL